MEQPFEYTKYQKSELEIINKEIDNYLRYLGELHFKLSGDNQKYLIDYHANKPINIPKIARVKLKELERKRDYLIRNPDVKLIVNWSDVKFENYRLRIKLDKIFSEPIFLSESRKSFEYLKEYLNNSKLKPLEVKVFQNKIVEVENLDELKKAFNILSIQDEINEYFQNLDPNIYERIQSKLNSIPNEEILNLYKIKEKGKYLEYLCSIQSGKFKIIPTTEIVTGEYYSKGSEETFMFTHVVKSNVYLIWESTMINRATYIFRSNIYSYSLHVQKIFDFIASNETQKRNKLRFSKKTGTNPMQICGIVEHNGIKDWKKSLKNLLI